MSVDVQTEIVIDRRCDEVAAYMSHPENAPEWYVNIKTMEWQTDPTVAVGAKAAFVAHFLGRRLAYVYEIVEYEPARRLVMRTADGPFAMETTYEFHPLDPTRTRVVLRNRGEPSGFSKLVAPFMSFAMRRANTKDLELLKKTVEALPTSDRLNSGVTAPPSP